MLFRSLVLRESVEPEDVEFQIVLKGARVAPEESKALWQEMESLTSKMNADAAKVDADAPWTSPDAEALDHKTLASWLAAVKGSSRARAALDVVFTADNGVATAKQSWLAYLALV